MKQKAQKERLAKLASGELEEEKEDEEEDDLPFACLICRTPWAVRAPDRHPRHVATGCNLTRFHGGVQREAHHNEPMCGHALNQDSASSPHLRRPCFPVSNAGGEESGDYKVQALLLRAVCAQAQRQGQVVLHLQGTHHLWKFLLLHRPP